MWQGNGPPSSIQDVYSYIDKTIKLYKSRIGKIEKTFFGGVDPVQYLLHIEEIFKSRLRLKPIKTQTAKIGDLQDLRLFIGTCAEGRRPGGVRETGFAKDLETFVSSFEKTVQLLLELLGDVRDLYDVLQKFCQNYQSLEGEFDLRWARTTKLGLSGTLESIEELLSSSDAGVNPKLFSTDKFSLEVAETCDTKRFPILRLFPDLFQKFHFVFSLMGRWRSNDQIYLENVQFNIIKTKRLQRLKQEEYDALETEHASILSGIVEKRIRVKCREIRDELKRLESEVSKQKTSQKKMAAEMASTEREIEERKTALFMNKNGTDISKASDDPLGVQKDLEILRRKLKTLRKSVRSHEKNLSSKVKEKTSLEEEYEEMRKSISRSNQLAYERSELAKDIANRNEKLKELEMIFYKKTDRQNLARAFAGMLA